MLALYRPDFVPARSISKFDVIYTKIILSCFLLKIWIYKMKRLGDFATFEGSKVDSGKKKNLHQI